MGKKKKKEKDKESLSEVSPTIFTTVMKSRDTDVKETKYECDNIAGYSELDRDELRKKKKKHKKMSINPQADDSNDLLFAKNKKKKNKHKRGDYQKDLNDCIAIDNKSEKNIINNASRSLENLNELDTNSKDYQEVIKSK